MGEGSARKCLRRPRLIVFFLFSLLFWRGWLKTTNIKEKDKSFKDKCSNFCAIAALTMCDENQIC